MTLAVGFFDGVHLGHRRILAGADAVLTFRNHPLSVLAPGRAPPLIMGVEERLEAIRACGVGEVVVTREVAEELFEHGRLQNTLVVAPPGGGKTSLLRDLIRTLSEGECGPGLRIGVTDPRGELGASAEGKCQLDLGCRTDLLHACPKEKGIMLLLL